MQKVRMRSNRILIKPIRNSEYSQGNIYTDRPKTTFTQHEGKDEQICQGEVISIGPGKWFDGRIIPTGVKKGQYVAFSDTCHRPSGVEDYIVIRSDDVMMVSDKPFKHVEVVY